MSDGCSVLGNEEQAGLPDPVRNRKDISMSTTTPTPGTDPYDDEEGTCDNRHIFWETSEDNEWVMNVSCDAPVHLVDLHEVLSLMYTAECNGESPSDAVFKRIDGYEDPRRLSVSDLTEAGVSRARLMMERRAEQRLRTPVTQILAQDLDWIRDGT